MAARFVFRELTSDTWHAAVPGDYLGANQPLPTKCGRVLAVGRSSVTPDMTMPGDRCAGCLPTTNQEARQGTPGGLNVPSGSTDRRDPAPTAQRAAQRAQEESHR